MSGNAWQALVVSFIPLVVVWRGWRRLTEQQLRQWSDRFGAVLDAETRPQVVHALSRGRRYRAVGTAVGLVVWSTPLYMNLIDSRRSADFAVPATRWAWLYGAALGATLAEVALVQRASGPRVASLVPRCWRDYLSPRPVVSVLIAIALGVVGGVRAVAGDVHESTQIVGLAVASAVAGVFLLVGLRQIVHRPLVAPDGSLRLMDEAFRADGANRLAGATTAMAGVSGLTAFTLAYWDAFPAFASLGFVLYPVVFGYWWNLTHDVVWRPAQRGLA